MRNEIIEHLVNITDPNIVYKSQQIGEDELTSDEKRLIVTNLLDLKKYSEFFNRFGSYLTDSHLKYFDEISNSNPDDYIIKTMVKNLSKSRKEISEKNRRFNALNQLLNHSNYFSEYEMMKRAPELYEELIGQFLDPEEIEERNKTWLKDITAFDLLMNENEMKLFNNLKKPKLNNTQGSKQKHVQYWGEMSSNKETNTKKISDEEKVQFRKEFRTQMIEQFLNGNDPDFDYNSINYDDDIQNRDFEDSYFDSEEAAAAVDQIDKNN